MRKVGAPRERISVAPTWVVVTDQLDEIDTSARVFHLARPDHSTIVVYPGADGRIGALARETLVALGKTTPGLAHSSAKLGAAAKEWIRAELVEDIVIYGAERLRGREHLFDETPCRIWAVTSSHKYAAGLLEKYGQSATIGEMFEALETEQPTTAEEESDPFPRVPYDEFFSFISSSRELHGAGPEFDLINRTFYESFRDARQLVRQGKARSEVTKRYVHEKMVASPCIRSAVCRLRGIQASLFDQWCYLRVDLLPALALWNVDSQKGEASEIATIGRQEIDSLPGIVMSIAHLTELTAQEATGPVSDFAPDGSSFTLQAMTISVPPELQAFFRHQFAEYEPATLFDSLAIQDRLVPKRIEAMLDSIESRSKVRFAHRDSRIGGNPQFFQHLEVHRLQRFSDPEVDLASL